MFHIVSFRKINFPDNVEGGLGVSCWTGLEWRTRRRLLAADHPQGPGARPGAGEKGRQAGSASCEGREGLLWGFGPTASGGKEGGLLRLHAAQPYPEVAAAISQLVWVSRFIRQQGVA